MAWPCPRKDRFTTHNHRAQYLHTGDRGCFLTHSKSVSCSSTHESSYFQCPPVILVQSNNSWRPEFAAFNGKSTCSTGTVFKWSRLDPPESSAPAPIALPAGYKKGFNTFTCAVFLMGDWRRAVLLKERSLSVWGRGREVKRKMAVNIILRNSIDKDYLCLNEHIWGIFFFKLCWFWGSVRVF